jgi:hypothetical protein
MTGALRQESLVVAQAAAAALEELAFLVVERVPPGERVSLGADVHWANVTAEGGGIRWVSIVMPVGLVAKIAAIVLDIPEDAVGEPELRDITGEVANTVCGALLRNIAAGAPFSIGLPVVGHGARELDVATCGREQLEVDGMRMEVMVGFATATDWPGVR